MISWLIRVTMLWVTMFQYVPVIRHHPKCFWAWWIQQFWPGLEGSCLDLGTRSAGRFFRLKPACFFRWDFPNDFCWSDSNLQQLNLWNPMFIWFKSTMFVALKPTSPPTFFLRCNSRSFSRNLWRSVSCGRTTMRGGLKPKRNSTLQKRTHNP